MVESPRTIESSQGAQLLGVSPERSNLFFADYVRYFGKNAAINSMKRNGTDTLKNQLYEIIPDPDISYFGVKEPMVAKFYSGPADKAAEGLFREYNGIEFMNKEGFSGVPQALHKNFGGLFAIYSFIDGEHKTAKELTRSNIDDMLGFMERLQQYKPNDISSSALKIDPSVSLGTPALLTADDYFYHTFSRYSQFNNLYLEAYKSGKDFLSKEIVDLIDFAPQMVAEFSDLDELLIPPLKKEELRLSPGDMGTHNTIFTKEEGEVKGFVDFEKFSWQDPVRPFAHFLTHNRMRELSIGNFSFAVEKVFDIIDPKYHSRFVIVSQYLSLEWFIKSMIWLMPQKLEELQQVNKDFDRESFVAKQTALLEERALLHSLMMKSF